MKRKIFNALSLVDIEGIKYRIVRTKKKMLLLFFWEENIPFSQAIIPRTTRYDRSCEKSELEKSKQRIYKEKSEYQGRICEFLGALGRAAKSLSGAKTYREQLHLKRKGRNQKVPIDPKIALIKDQKREVDPPAPVPVRQLRNRYANAFSEFIALTSATLKVYIAQCKGILELYLDKSEAKLTAALEDTEVGIYDYVS
ncbi:hypothetical protein EVAR_34292_1 [Eumeta japonica]|uniref:Uncharacterized protein n=1 Tax=Eumeta variegata TaxID=151549 RepID=A0A4C1VVW3_EUMVA|nr:hypothetical protein EVAR_34292_1 [Eumeta japonica]